MTPTTHCVLVGIFITAEILAIAGIDFTASVFILDNKNALGDNRDPACVRTHSATGHATQI
jgi:hypothetical protein